MGIAVLVASWALAGCAGEPPAVVPTPTPTASSSTPPAPSTTTSSGSERAALAQVEELVQLLSAKGSECTESQSAACAYELAGMVRDTTVDVLEGLMPLARHDLTGVTEAVEELALNEHVIACYAAELESHCRLAVGDTNIGADAILAELAAIGYEQL